MQVFLSHSSNDKPRIKRIKKDLESHQIECWVDEEEIPFGGSITEYIERGLNESEIIMVFLSKNSVHSQWVKTEWQTKFFDQVNKNKITVIPVLLEKCDIPPMLKGRRYVDFSIKSEYEINLSNLLNQLNKNFNNVSHILNNQIIESVYQFSSEIIEELKDESISFPFPSKRKLKIIESLSKIPRSGKYLRLRKFKPALEIRSIYDHMHSVAHVADQILPCIDHGLKDHEFAEFARIVAFHELNEIILGDIPTYTELSNRKRRTYRLYAENRLRTVSPSERERISNDLIWLFLSGKQRKSMEKVNSHMKTKSKVFILFKCFDRIDPIIATWRYLHVYRGKLGKCAGTFLREMKDFFENPDVRSFIKDNKVDTKLYKLATSLQTRKNAVGYYKNSDYLKRLSSSIGIPADNIKKAIEEVPLSGMYKR